MEHKNENNTIELEHDKQDSIEVSRTVRGTYTWKIKRYYNFDEKTPSEVIETMTAIDNELKSKFKSD